MAATSTWNSFLHHLSDKTAIWSFTISHPPDVHDVRALTDRRSFSQDIENVLSSQKCSSSLQLSNYDSACVKAYYVSSLSVGRKLKTTSTRGAYLTLQQGTIFQVRHIFPFTDKVKDVSQKQQQWFFSCSQTRNIFPIELRWLARPKMLSPQDFKMLFCYPTVQFFGFCSHWNASYYARWINTLTFAFTALDL